MTGPSSEPPATWLADLERAVTAAVAEIRRLREENDGLAARLRRAEQEAAAQAAPGARAWETERDEVRRRVQNLVSGLEELLEA